MIWSTPPLVAIVYTGCLACNLKVDEYGHGTLRHAYKWTTLVELSYSKSKNIRNDLWMTRFKCVGLYIMQNDATWKSCFCEPEQCEVIHGLWKLTCNNLRYLVFCYVVKAKGIQSEQLWSPLYVFGWYSVRIKSGLCHLLTDYTFVSSYLPRSCISYSV
jgi:hypothetical protein